MVQCPATSVEDRREANLDLCSEKARVASCTENLEGSSPLIRDCEFSIHVVHNENSMNLCRLCLTRIGADTMMMIASHLQAFLAKRARRTPSLSRTWSEEASSPLSYDAGLTEPGQDRAGRDLVGSPDASTTA